MADDPATARSHAILWKAVFPPEIDDRSVQIVVGESPAPRDGEWVTADGMAGDAQKAFSEFGVDDYKKHIRECEATMALDVLRRKGDPRAFGTEQMQAEGGMTYFELFARDDSGRDAGCGTMFFEPAKIRATITDDLQDAGKLVDLLACDWEKEINATNHPHLLISDACQNLITCLLNWDGTAKTAGRTRVVKTERLI
jgi:hypothetical protein